MNNIYVVVRDTRVEEVLTDIKDKANVEVLDFDTLDENEIKELEDYYDEIKQDKANKQIY